MVGGVICLVLSVASAGLSIYANSDACRTWGVEQANQLIHGHLSVRAHRVDLLAGRMVLFDFKLTDIDGNAVAAAKALSVRIRWSALLGRSLHITALTIEDPIFLAEFNQQDQLNLLRIVPSNGTPAATSTSRGMLMCGMKALGTRRISTTWWSTVRVSW